MTKILIVDDDPDFILAMQMALEANGFEVGSATTPDAGLDQAQTTNPDLVLLDIMMPSDNEGFDVVRSIRETPDLEELPIIVLTNLHKSRGSQYRFAPDDDYLPVNAFMDKSSDPDAVIEAIKQALGTSREQPEHPL
jgi:CheY-like chemotaxis protein